MFTLKLLSAYDTRTHTRVSTDSVGHCSGMGIRMGGMGMRLSGIGIRMGGIELKLPGVCCMIDYTVCTMTNSSCR